MNNLRQKMKLAYDDKISYLFQDDYDELNKCDKNRFKFNFEDYREEVIQYSYTEFLKKKIDENRCKITHLKESRPTEAMKIGPNLDYYRQFI